MAAQQGKLTQPDMNKAVQMSKEECVKMLKKTSEVQLDQMKQLSSKMNMQ